MDQFTWIKTYKEIAAKLREYRDRQQELIGILADMQKRGLPIISLIDKNAQGAEIALTEIDPFTFFASFNKRIKTETRIEILRMLKDVWGLTSSIPSDFSGIPVVHNQQAWFIAYQKDRGAQDIPLLWELFIQALDDNINEDTFNAVLEIKYIRYNITMGLFWIDPERYLNLDKVNREYLAKNGIAITGLPDYQTYISYIEKTRSVLPKPFVQISHDAWLQGNKPVTRGEGSIGPRESTKSWLFAPGRGGEHWNEFYSQGIMAIGWDNLGDLQQYNSKNDIADAMREYDNEPESSKKNNATSCFSFCREMQPGDHVFAKVGRNRIVGWGIITSEYIFDPSRSYYKNIRKIDWKAKGEWTVSEDNRFALKTVTDVTKYQNFVQYLHSLVGPETETSNPSDNENMEPEYSIEECAKIIGYSTDRIASWISAIKRKKQAVFYGPPGTGKTFIASHLARHIVGGTYGIMDCIQFHPAYTYEEFIQGICPNADKNGNLRFDLKPGRFLEFCAKARHRTGPCVLIIDEINRANIARVFGELMYLLEYRDKDIPLAGGIRFSIANNVLIIGTMNTADRSIALVDFALRRRFAFLELSPEYDILKAFQEKRGFDAGGLVRSLLEVNTKITDKNYYLGISFFMVDDLAKKLEEIWKMEIETYLEEYFFSQPEVMNNFRWDRMRGKILP